VWQGNEFFKNKEYEEVNLTRTPLHMISSRHYCRRRPLFLTVLTKTSQALKSRVDLEYLSSLNKCHERERKMRMGYVSPTKSQGHGGRITLLKAKWFLVAW